MQTMRTAYYEARLYLGARRLYQGPTFSENELVELVREFQASRAMIAVRISPTRYVAGDYVEPGWELAVVNYPERPQPEARLDAWVTELAQFLMNRVNQDRVLVAFPRRGEAIVFNAETAATPPDSYASSPEP